MSSRDQEGASGRWSRLQGRIILVVLGIGLALLIVELALRVMPIPNRFTMIRLFEEMWETDPELLLRLKPSLDMEVYGHPEFSFSVQTNQEGLRDAAFPAAVDIAAIGDSFTFGFGVEANESWPGQLERITGLEVANLGWAGWSSYVYPVAIRRYAIPLEAKIWIWAFFANDLPESASAEAFIASGSEDYLAWNQAGRYRARDLPFPWSLRTLQFIAALSNPELFLLPGSGEKLYVGPQFTMRYGAYAWETTDPGSWEVQRGWELTEEALKTAKQLADKHSAELVLLYIPPREHVYWPYLAPVISDHTVQQLDDVESRLEEICAEHNVAFLSLLPAFRERALTGEMLYFPQDGHWNSSGHTLAARSVQAFLQDLQLLPDVP